jgi:hypothetical protein
MYKGRPHWSLDSLELLPKLNKERHTTLILFLLISCNTTVCSQSSL